MVNYADLCAGRLDRLDDGIRVRGTGGDRRIIMFINYGKRLGWVEFEGKLHLMKTITCG